MFDILAQGLPELAGAVTSGAQPLMDGAGIQFNPPDNQQTGGVTTLFNILETGIRLLIGLAVLGAVGFCAKGGIDLMRAGGSPQMMEKARNQIIFSGLGAAVAVGSFFFVGTVVDFLSQSSGGRTAKIGVIDVQAKIQRVEVGAFLGVYAGQAISCPPAGTTAGIGSGGVIEATKIVKTDGDRGDAEWKFVDTPSGGSDTAHCLSIAPSS